MGSGRGYPTRLNIPKTGTQRVMTTVLMTVLMMVTTTGLTSEARVLAAVLILPLQKLETPRSTVLNELALLLIVTTRIITGGNIGRLSNGPVKDLFRCIEILMLRIVRVTMMPLAALVMTLSVRRTGILERTTAFRPWSNWDSVIPRNSGLNIGACNPTGLIAPCICGLPPQCPYRTNFMTRIMRTKGTNA